MALPWDSVFQSLSEDNSIRKSLNLRKKNSKSVSVSFREFKAIYPPHPAMTWKPEALHAMPGYQAQLKYDDWRILIYFFPDGKIRFYNRRKAPLHRYRPPAALMKQLRKLRFPKGGFHILDGGLMHYRTKRVKNTVVLWDILVQSGEFLVGTTYRERYALLRKICRGPKKNVILDSLPVGLKIGTRLWLAPLFSKNFKKLFERASPLPEIEGIVLKKMSAPLQRSHRMEGNAPWMIRVRKPRIDYTF